MVGNGGNRRRSPVGVDAVFRRWRRNGCTPACTAWRGRRGGRGAAPGGGDSTMAAGSSGNGGSTASTDTVVLGFGFTGSTARERERESEGGGRGGRPRPYPSRGSGSGASRASRIDRVGRYSRRGGRRPRHFTGNPFHFLFSFYSSPFLISFSVFDLNTAVKELFGVPKQFQKL